jgi:hypothetical protein
VPFAHLYDIEPREILENHGGSLEHCLGVLMALGHALVGFAV